MADFQYEGLSCDFSNTFEDDIATSTYLSAHGIPEQATRDAAGNVAESTKRAWLRTFCMIAAHAKNVSGAGNWQPPGSPFDTTDAEIRASAKLFFRTFGATEQHKLLAWATALHEHLQGKKSLVPTEQQSSGDKDVDFLVTQASASIDAT